MTNLLIIEDDQELNNGISFALQEAQTTIYQAFTKQEGLTIQQQHPIDLIILDVNLPDGNGYDLCKHFRTHSTIPILFLTANDTEEDMLHGFEVGCDDYIAKPFSIAILKKRIQAILKRTNQQKHLFTYKDLSINYDKRTVKLRGQEIYLTGTEYKIVELLTKNQGQVLTRSTLIEKVWDTYENYVDENALSVNIRRLRKKLETNPKEPVYIITVFGIGYTLGDS